jgi:hypothetical protein
MTKDWSEIVAEAQLVTHYEIGGRLLPRIKYGEEKEDWGADSGPCPDCGVVKDQYHLENICDVERCPSCGFQVISCDCEYADGNEDEYGEESLATNT